MRRTRFISLLFLVLSLAFFGLREFRQGLIAPLAGMVDVGGLGMAGRISIAELNDLAHQAEERGDGQSLAFAALHLPIHDDAKIRKLADLAVERDPSLIWIYHHLAFRFVSEWYRAEVAEGVRTWATQLTAWDPENAAPYLLQAELVRQQRASLWPPGRGTDPAYLEGLVDETDWRAAMESAFTKPRYDFYSGRRFELERHVMRQQGWDHPATMLVHAREWPIPDLFNISDYANLLVHKLGGDAEAAGRIDDALAQDWKVAHFGECLRLGGRSQTEQLAGDAVRSRGYKRLIPLLKKIGRQAEAGTLDYGLAQLRQERDVLTGKVPLARSSNYNWSVFLLNVFAGLVVIFLALTLLCVLYVNVKRSYRVQKRGTLWEIMTVGENYMPLLFFVACLGLYVTYYPYAQNFSYYMTAQGPVENFEPLFYNVLPSYSLPTAPTQLELQNPFGGYAQWALTGILAVLLLALGSRWREARTENRKKGPTRGG